MAKCERILLIEDDADLLETAAELIEQQGLTVVRCRDATVALDALRAGPAPDLIVLDLTMPKMSGEQFLRVVRGDERWRRLPVVAMSGFPERRFANLGFDAFISKPFDAVELDEVVGRLCGTESAAPGTAERAV